MKNKKTNNLYKKIIFWALLVYFIYTLIMQQQTLNAYAEQKEKCNNDIEIAEEQQGQLQKIKENINSNEYIEQIAREKLGMYYPNERVYIDIEK